MALRAPATLVIAVAFALLAPALARADFQTLYDDYRSDGVIDGCSYTSAQLSAGLSGIPADIAQYDPGFTDSINAAFEQSAAGCELAPEPTPKNTITASDGSPGPQPPRPPSFSVAGDGRELPGVLVALIALLAAALAAGALLVAAHRRGRAGF